MDSKQTDPRPVKCYRVWFKDGSPLLVDATCYHKARAQAYRIAKGNGSTGDSLTVKRAECLNK